MNESNEITQQVDEGREPVPLAPYVDVFEDASGITVYADLPGVSKEGLELNIKEETLTIRGTISLGTPQGMEAVHAEVNSSKYQRTFTLSKELDSEKTTAQFESGVLKLRIPKGEHAQPRRIDVRVD
ncbi:MAG TPA: Hsp20/alpha crystallin family protein [Burkholderiaceae bacterium]|nr:Hsp20/alpha crystallin family protein [Burkholderiaceae bacterium]